MNLLTPDRGVLIAVNSVKLIAAATVLILILMGLAGCSSGGGSHAGNDCRSAFVLPAGYPDSVDGFYGLIYNNCYYTQAEMEQLRREMHAASLEVMACLDSVYNYDFHANSKDDIPFPYASKVQILHEPFKGRDGKVRDIQYLQAGYFVKYHPRKKADGTWNLWRWTGELHTMYRVEMLSSWDHGVVYDKDLPFENAANIANRMCIRQWKPAS
jgi:hypothetical protein